MQSNSITSIFLLLFRSVSLFGQYPPTSISFEGSKWSDYNSEKPIYLGEISNLFTPKIEGEYLGVFIHNDRVDNTLCFLIRLYKSSS